MPNETNESTAPTIDVQVGEALKTWLASRLPGFTVVRQYEDVREFLNESDLASPKAVLVLEGMEEIPEYDRTARMDFRFVLGLYKPLAGSSEEQLTASMDEAMAINYTLADAFYQKFILHETLGRIVLLEATRTGGQMYDEELFRLYRIFGNEYSLTVQTFREIPKT